MSNKTIIPGAPATPTPSAPSQGTDGGFYNRSATATDRTRTYIPDVYKRAAREGADAAIPEDKGKPVKSLKMQDRTIVGALFTVSRFTTGEIYPVYIGRNTIGTDTDCDICLSEQSVAPRHAVIVARAIEEPSDDAESQSSNAAPHAKRNLKLFITDYDTNSGTTVGDVKLEYDKVECHDHDIIKVGKVYQFLLCLFEGENFGLYVDNSFRAIDRPEPTPDPAEVISTVLYAATPATPQAAPLPPTISEAEERTFYAPSKKRKIDHSGNKTI